MRKLLFDLSWYASIILAIVILCGTTHFIVREVRINNARDLTDIDKYHLTRIIMDAYASGNTNFASWDWAQWYVVDLEHDAWGTEIQYSTDDQYPGFCICKTAGADMKFDTVDDFEMKLFVPQ